MIKNRRKKKREETERVYILLCDGYVQFYDYSDMTGLVWSNSYDDAKRFASEMCNDEGGRIVVREIGNEETTGRTYCWRRLRVGLMRCSGLNTWGQGRAAPSSYVDHVAPSFCFRGGWLPGRRVQDRSPGGQFVDFLTRAISPEKVNELGEDQS